MWAQWRAMVSHPETWRGAQGYGIDSLVGYRLTSCKALHWVSEKGPAI